MKTALHQSAQGLFNVKKSVDHRPSKRKTKLTAARIRDPPDLHALSGKPMAAIIWVRPDLLATGTSFIGECSKANSRVFRGSDRNYVGADLFRDEGTAVASRQEKRRSQGG